MGATWIAWIAFPILAAVLGMATGLNASVRTQQVSYKSGSATVSGYLALPGNTGKHPALVVIHEWWGLRPWVKEQARNFASQGYVALAVDLYRGKTTDDPKVARQLSRALPRDRALGDLRAAFDYLASRPDVDKAKIGAVGWCFGGGWALQMAIHQPGIAACAINYGELVTDAASMNAIHCPVLGNFGALDHGITPEEVHAFEAAMKKAGKSVDDKIYADAGHAFENPDNKSGYRPRDAADAWTRMVAFFNQALKK